MRAMLIAWGRQRWPGARVFHELNVNQNRADLAFILPADLILIEIKSSKDTLDRLPKQIEAFESHATKFYVAHDPQRTVDYSRRLVVRLEQVLDVRPGVYEEGWGHYSNKQNWRCYTHLIDLIWASEAIGIARRYQLDVSSRSPMGVTLPLLAAKLTGEQILREVCRELRGRVTFRNESDAPIYDVVPADDVPLKGGRLL